MNVCKNCFNLSLVDNKYLNTFYEKCDVCDQELKQFVHKTSEHQFLYIKSMVKAVKRQSKISDILD